MLLKFIVLVVYLFAGLSRLVSTSNYTVWRLERADQGEYHCLWPNKWLLLGLACFNLFAIGHLGISSLLYPFDADSVWAVPYLVLVPLFLIFIGYTLWRENEALGEIDWVMYNTAYPWIVPNLKFLSMINFIYITAYIVAALSIMCGGMEACVLYFDL